VKSEKYLAEMDELRESIDRIDREIVKMLNQRAGYALRIGEIKLEIGMPVYMPRREEDVLKNVCTHNPGPLSMSAVTRLYERIIDESRRLEQERHSEKKDDK
jgi:chorismate mutase